MINIKEIVYQALYKVCENVSDTYPKNWAKYPAIQYMEEENKVVEWTDDKEQKSYVRYRIDIWDNISTSAMALAIDECISNDTGLIRIQCLDIDDPSGLKHKTIRYEGIIEKNANGDIYVYHQTKE